MLIQKKILLSSIMLFIMIGIGGCGNDNKKNGMSTSDSSTIRKESGKEKLTGNNLNITIKDIKLSENGDGKKKIVTIKLDTVNKNKVEYGLGGGDFKLEVKNKKYEVIPSASNIGTEIKSEAKVVGEIFFEIPKESKKATLLYMPLNSKEEKILANWKIDI